MLTMDYRMAVFGSVISVERGELETLRLNSRLELNELQDRLFRNRISIQSYVFDIGTYNKFVFPSKIITLWLKRMLTWNVVINYLRKLGTT